jgi:hypothetical protein
MAKDVMKLKTLREGTPPELSDWALIRVGQRKTYSTPQGEGENGGRD